MVIVFKINNKRIFNFPWLQYLKECKEKKGKKKEITI